MANPTIVSVRVAQRIDLGTTWYNAQACYPEKVTVLSKPFFEEYVPGTGRGTWRIKLVDEYGMIRSPSLGDLGVKGYAYDTRPVQLVRTEEECKQAINAFTDWQMTHDFV